MTETEFAATARVYAVGGWKVFPLWWIVDGRRCACPNGKLSEDSRDYCGRRADGTVSGSPGKHPITRNGVKDATTDLDTITSWWDRCPLANPGLPAGDNGLAIIDVDSDKGGDKSLAELNAYTLDNDIDLLHTLTAHTGGGGLHLIYTAPDGGIINKSKTFGPDLPGLDTRGTGGYIVAWPSIHISGARYEWVDFSADPAPWPDILTPIISPPKPPPPERIDHKPTGNRGGYATKALENEINGVLAATEGSRNDRLHLAAFNLGQLVQAGQLSYGTVFSALMSAALMIGLGESEARNTIRSGFKGGAAKPRMGRAA